MKPSECKAGTPVTYHPVRAKDGSSHGEPMHTVITHDAWTANPGNRLHPPLVVCMIEGKAGYVSIRHLEPRTI